MSTSTTAIWTAEVRRYELREHDPANAVIRRTVRRKTAWFPGTDPDESPSVLFYLMASDDLLWTLLSIDDPDAPSRPRPPASNREEWERIGSEYRDSVIEAISIDGQLIASKRYDHPSRVPIPISPDRWYDEDSDLLRSIRILEPRLTPRF